jgi:translation initiation factor 1 (eIF-1/SUI1)
MAESFTSKQKEIVARKMGYDGPMQMFDEFLSASPSDAQKYSAITSKFAERMAKGGMVRKFAAGGAAISDEEIKNYIAANQGMSDKQVAAKMDELGLSVDQIARGYGLSGNEVQARYDAAKGVTTKAATTDTTVGAPTIPGASSYTAAQTATPTNATAGQAGVTDKATVTNVATPVGIGMPTVITAPTATAASSSKGVSDILTNVDAQQGVVSDAAKAVAATQEPTTTAVANTQAAQGVASTVQNAPTRTVQEGEMVSGSAVDMAKVEDTLAKTQAAQGTVTDDMTVQGQLNKLLTNFDAGTPPPWAAASMRAANAQMAARGIGASSMAGQAIIQATLEAATPIAAADAKVFETMGLQNLSNRQQTAILVGQQRAAFLGQDFDQAFQTRVLNAAKVADIANKNFDAQTQIVIENSRLAGSMDIANLSAKNAVVLGKMAQMSQLETANLNNRQQVAVENAKAFLMMDIKNLDNKQQTMLFRAQEMSDALVSDAGFANATAITNAANALDAAKVSSTLMQSAQQFNADQLNKVNMTNALAANEIGKFNAQQAQQREEFNANMTTQINLANAKILAEVSVANTAATNAANAVNAKNATDLAASTYAQQSQTYRDLLEQSWKTGEAVKDRATEIVKATLTSNATVTASSNTAKAASTAAIGGAVVKVLESDKVWTAVSDAWDKLTTP